MKNFFKLVYSSVLVAVASTTMADSARTKVMQDLEELGLKTGTEVRGSLGRFVGVEGEVVGSGLDERERLEQCIARTGTRALASLSLRIASEIEATTIANGIEVSSERGTHRFNVIASQEFVVEVSSTAQMYKLNGASSFNQIINLRFDNTMCSTMTTSQGRVWACDDKKTSALFSKTDIGRIPSKTTLSWISTEFGSDLCWSAFLIRFPMPTD